MPRKRQDQTDAERIPAHQERQARRGQVRLEIALDQQTAEWIRQEARESRRTVGEVVTNLVNRELILRRSTAEAAAGFEVLYTPEADR